jgi:uroporphyrin-III C-methyltransferase
MKTGKVYLIGAGPGDIELLTLKAVRVLREADVVLLDDLVSREALCFARPDAQIIEVGKRGGRRSTPQIAIHELMLKHATAGRIVARLKGGDPFVFGRGGEEMQSLLVAGMQVEVISGVTAGVAVPAALGIPVSHRDYSRSITFVTGHPGPVGSVNWPQLAEIGETLVIYMGMANLPHIVAELLAAGMPPSRPAAAIQDGTLPHQRSVMTTLVELPAAVSTKGLGSPAIVVIGEVVGLAAGFSGTPKTTEEQR